MTDTIVLFLPGGDTAARWLRIADDAVVARGEGVPVPDPAVAFVAIAPASAVALHWAELPDRSEAQARTAARLLAAEASLTLVDDLHVAIGRERGMSARPIAVVSAATMTQWLAALAAEGWDPRAIIPAAMLLPRPDQGFVSADLGDETVVRGATSAFADEAPVTDLITGGAAPVALDREAIEAAILAAVADPPLDLRQGPFARRSPRRVDWARVRRMAWIGAAVALVSLLIGFVQLVRIDRDASWREDLAAARARAVVGDAPGDPVERLHARLAARRGGGAGFSHTAATVFAVTRGVAGSELRTMRFDADGTMRVLVAAETPAAIDAVRDRIGAAGFAVRSGPPARAGARPAIELTVAPR